MSGRIGSSCWWLAPLVLFALGASGQARAQNSYGVLERDERGQGFTLFALQRGTSAYLVSHGGRLVHRWDEPDGYSPSGGIELTASGTLVRALSLDGPMANRGGSGGLVRAYDWDGSVLWQFELSTETEILHHDIAVLPNGDVIASAWEMIDEVECETRLPSHPDVDCASFRAETLLQLRPDGLGGADVVWSWRLLDHMISGEDVANAGDHAAAVAAHPEKWDPARGTNYNSLDYHAGFRQILIGCNMCNEIFVIEHDDQPGNAGFVFRWGNPQSYGAGTAADRKLMGQHSVRWIKSEFGHILGDPDGGPASRAIAAANHVGNISVFNNRHSGCPTSAACSAVVEIEPPVDVDGRYAAPVPGESFGPEDFALEIVGFTRNDGSTGTEYSQLMGSAQRIPGGRYIVNVPLAVPSHFLEVDVSGTVYWEYAFPVYTHNPDPGRLAGWFVDRCDDGYVAATAQSIPPDPDGAGPLEAGNTWVFQAMQYGYRFFEDRRLPPGELLTDLVSDPVCTP